MYNFYISFSGSGMARANPGYSENEEESLTGARPKRPTMPLRLNHQPPRAESLLTPPALDDVPLIPYQRQQKPTPETTKQNPTSPCYAIRLMQAQLDDRYKTVEEAEQAAASPITGTTTNNTSLQHPPMASNTQDLTKLEADVVLLNKQLLDLGDKWNFFAAKYSEAKDQLLAAKLQSETMSKQLHDAIARLHEAELDKTLTEFHLQLSESATAYYKRTCEELKQKLEDVVKTIKATQLAIVTPQVTTIIPISLQDKPNHNSSYNEIVSAYYIIGLTIFFFFLLFFFLLVTP
jgi:hypothetical protein